MKKIEFGDMLSVSEGIIVQGCNAQGVMGSGLAAQIRMKWPKVFQPYKDFIDECNAKKIDPLGDVNLVNVGENLYVANAITQRDFGRDKTIRYCSYQAIYDSMKYVACLASGGNLSVHYPSIGAGLANGDWSIISDVIDAAFDEFPEVTRTFWIYEP